MKHVNKSRFDKIKLQWDLRKIAAGVLKGDEAVGEMLATAHNPLQSLIEKGYDILMVDKKDLQSSKSTESFFETDNQFEKFFREAMTTSITEFDEFGNAKRLSDKEIIKRKMDELEELGNKLLSEEKYEEMQEAKEIYDKLKKEHDKL